MKARQRKKATRMGVKICATVQRLDAVMIPATIRGTQVRQHQEKEAHVGRPMYQSRNHDIPV